MPLQNRVTPFGELVATPARGMLMGNRGGRLHDAQRGLGNRRWRSKQWICCKLTFNNRHREVWGNSYSELFFLDEVTAFAAGHRPCFECRRKDAECFAALFSNSAPNSAHSRLRGDEWRSGKRWSAKAMDDVLHTERLNGALKRVHRLRIDTLPDGAMIAIEDDAFAIREPHLLRWTPSGYEGLQSRPRGIDVDVLTPPSILAALAKGYSPLWHLSAG